MMSRQEKVQAVMEWLGSLATEEDAEKVLDALERAGYQIVHEPGRGAVQQPPMGEKAWWAFVEHVLAGKGGPYRAAYYISSSGQETVLTGPEQAHLPDADLIEAAVAEAHNAGIVGNEYPQITEEALRQGIRIGLWTPPA